MRSKIRTQTYSPVRSAREIGRGPFMPGGMLAKIVRDPATGSMIDVIGISISDKASVRAEIWALLFDAEDGPYTDEQRITNIEASSGLLNMYELIGKAGVGYVLYSTGTPQATLNKAIRYFYRHALFIDSEPLLIDGEILEAA